MKICEIHVSVGAVCTYSHRGICQHDLIVTDVRLINYKDPQSAEQYPFQIFACKNKRRICEVCEKLHAKFVSMKDQSIGVPYIYLCDECLKSNSPSCEVFPYIYD